MGEKKWDVFIYGDANIDIVIPGVARLPLPGQEEDVAMMDTFVGGGSALFALGLGKLGLTPAFQGVLGQDLYGQFIAGEFTRMGVDHSLVQISPTHKTGISLSFTNERDRSFLTYRGTNAQLDVSDISLEDVRRARHIHITSYQGRRNHAQHLDLMRRIKACGDVSISMDVGWDETGEWFAGIYDLLPYIDVLFMNEQEAIHYARKPDAMQAAQDFAQHCRLAVIKLGKRGSLAVTGNLAVQATAYTVSAVDTTGAGDSFNAGFIYGYLKGRELKTCLQYGNGCGALSVTALGGNTAFPTLAQLLAFISQEGEQA